MSPVLKVVLIIAGIILLEIVMKKLRKKWLDGRKGDEREMLDR